MKKQKLRKILSYNVKYYRFSVGYTQEKLAEKCDISTRYISDIKNANGNISIDMLEKIAKSLQVSSYLLLKSQKFKPLPTKINMK